MYKQINRIALFTTLVAVNIVAAQQATWLNPSPHGNDVLDIEFCNTQQGLMCGTYGSVYMTNDGGTNWLNASLATPEPLRQIIWLSAAEAIVVGKNHLYKSQDGGLNWDLLFQAAQMEFTRAAFLENMTAYALSTQPGGQVAVTKTTDGGLSWNTIATDGSWRDLAFRNPLEGMLVDSSKVYKTTDGGATFTVVYEESLSREWNSIVHAGGDVWVAAGHKIYGTEGRFLRSADNGATWDVIFSTAQQHKRIKRTPDGLLYAFGSISEIYNLHCSLNLSTDQGLTWSSDFFDFLPNTPYQRSEEIKAAGMISPSKGFAYAYQRVSDDEPDPGNTNVLLQKDGNTWVFFNNHFFRTIYELQWDGDGNEGWLAEYGFLARSSDGGLSWEHIPHPAGNAMEETRFFRKLPGSGKAIAISMVLRSYPFPGFEAGQFTSIYHSSNGGSTWTSGIQKELASPLGFAIFNPGDAYLFARTCGIAWKKGIEYYPKVCGHARLFASRDFGDSWTEISLPLDTMANMQFLNADTGYIFGGGGTTPDGGYYLSTDKGLSWQYHPLGLPKIALGQMLSPSLGFLVTDEVPARIFRVHPASGQSLEIFACPPSHSIGDIGFTGENTGYVLCHTPDTAFIYSTSDGGLNWNPTGVYPYLKKLKIFSNLNGFAYGSSGRLLKLEAGYPVSVRENTEGRKCIVRLFPNPAKDLIYLVTEGLTAGLPLDFELTDALGRVFIRKSFSNPLLQDNLRISTSSLNPGIYLYRIKAGDRIQSGKLLIHR
jgi:photosystem II stability/assembly factor-like uncharacterized protein